MARREGTQEEIKTVKNRETKYIFVSGGVISGVGKGITAASIGAVIKAKGLKVSMQKCDPYFNVDAGLLNATEHGECFVTKDGAETDLDLGHYERFIDEAMTDESSTSSGKLLMRLLTDERAGKFGGKSVQLIPQFTGLIQDTFEENAETHQSDVHIVEIGGTVGDMEGTHFLEAIREFPTRVGRENCFYVYVVYVPYLSTSEEYKTKPAQNAIRDLREFGIVPDMVVARLDGDGRGAGFVKKKLSVFGGVAEDAVILLPNARSVYEVPLKAVKGGVLGPLDRYVNHGDPDMSGWEKLMKQIEAKPRKKARVGLVVEHVENTDMYLSVTEALKAAGWAEGVAPEVVWIDASKATEEDFAGVDGLLVPGGTGPQSAEGKIKAAEYALEHDVPYMGLCIGLQTSVIAACRRGGLENANTEKLGASAKKHNNVIVPIDEAEGKKTSAGRLMRLGEYKTELVAGSRVAGLYKKTIVIERYRHRFKVNEEFVQLMEKGGLVVSGESADNGMVEFVEAPEAKFFVATQAHPEYVSRPMQPHPLFVGFVKSLV